MLMCELLVTKIGFIFVVFFLLVISGFPTRKPINMNKDIIHKYACLVKTVYIYLKMISIFGDFIFFKLSFSLLTGQQHYYVHIRKPLIFKW